MSGPSVNVMGATGRLGRRIVAALLERGADPDHLILGVRDLDKARRLGFGDLQVRVADYDDPDSLARAFRRSDVVLLIPTSEGVDRRLRQHANALAAAEEADVGRIVFSSFVACRPGSRFRRARFYRTAESQLRAVGPAWTIVRAGLYLEFVAAHASAQMETGMLSLPVERGKAAYIGRDDLARGLAAACVGGNHTGGVYELTGDEALSMVGLTARVQSAIGRPLAFRTVTSPEYAAACRARGLPPSMVDAWTTMWNAVEAGEVERVTDHLEHLTGQPPRPLEESLSALLASGAGQAS